jgi:hypothetical protein
VEREPVFIAATASEAGVVEQILDDEGIAYEQRLEPSLEASSSVCYMGVLFEVPADAASRCRELLKERGLGRGLVG